MRCAEITELISLYIDNMLDEHTTHILEGHFKECEVCRQEYEEMLSIQNMCRELPLMELPVDFESSLHEKLQRVLKDEQNSNVANISSDGEGRKKIHWKNWKVFISAAAVLVLLVFSVSMNDFNIINDLSKSQMSMESADMRQSEGSFPLMAPELAKDSVENRGVAVEGNNTEGAKFQYSGDNVAVNGKEVQDVQAQQGRKVIKNGYIDLDVENYDEKFSRVAQIAFDNGGFVENTNTQYKHYNDQNPKESLKVGNISIRIPEDRFLAVIEQIKALGRVTNFGINGQDITKEYRDTANEIENLKIQEKRLREIMEKANNVRDILEIERELSRVRGDIHRLSGDIQRWDELVSLSTIYVNLNEVEPKDKQIQPISHNIWEKAKKEFIKTINGMIQFLENLFIAVASKLPIVLTLSMIGIPMGWYFVKRIKKENHKNE
ncbi:DUF4349 domain-containing protein [Thermotalea metallivorans]|uniref:Anti-sigma-W factor RsiW n=1 Tax=Thermotalea metallivorans TaxID=520762 RepID=A0A140L972_9FIRM|nr:DUF4349 domain-containing protein [Thermotalea metallivorans]KXG77097.1 Anti-sigma-W factor RsiW [Thermotalea metallivorans]